MKKIFRHMVFGATLLLTLSGCTGFLDENLETGLSDDSAYASPRALEAQVYGVLEGFYGTYMMMGYMNELLHSASGLIIWKGQRTQDQWISGLKFAKYSDTEETQKIYEQLYAAVGRCNRLLDNLPSSPVDEDFKKGIEGETKFYRAVLYYYLVRLYGDVPLILTAPKKVADLARTRTPYYTVYNQVLSDLSDAESLMRTKKQVDSLTAGKGRPCNWAATSMKASVYMTIGSMLSSYEADPEDQFFDASREERKPDFSASGIANASEAWTLAFQTAEKVIAEGPYALADDYRQLFRWDTAEDFNLPERIFVLQSTNSTNPQNRIEEMSLPLYPEATADTLTKSNNSGRYRPSRFLFQKFAADNGGVKGSKDDTKNIYVSCKDPRFAASFFFDYYTRADNGKKSYLYPRTGYIYESGSTYAFPYFKKYRDPRYNVTSGYADFYFMRYAEIFLISAEAAAHLSAASGDDMWNTALARVETIHQRARKSTDGAEAAFPSWAARTFADQAELINAIIWEREYEMSGEGHEWFDTHRNGAKWLSEQIAKPLNAHLQEPEQGPGLGSDGNDDIGIFAYTYVGTLAPTDPSELRKSLLCAFPMTTEGAYNTAIDPVNDQNDFYWK